jgi:hypothetical protein
MAKSLKLLKMQLDAMRPPSSESVGRLVKKVQALEKYLQQKEPGLPADRIDRLNLISKQFSSEVQTNLKFKNDELDRDDWEAKPQEDRQRIVATLDGFLTELTDLNGDELSTGKRYFTIFIILFTLLSGSYVYLHSGGRRHEVDPATITDAASKLQRINLEINGLRKKTRDQNGTYTTKDLDEAIAAVKDFRATAEKLDFSAPAFQLLGSVEAEVAKGEITETDTFAKLSKTVSVELESSRSFLWSDGERRWIEIAFWAELGTLVGVLFYIAGCLSEGLFLAKEIAMFWAEVFIAPIVVLAIFFLFSFTGITGISLQETSITGIVGLAFIFGFAIRRTLGLFDTIKKRVFPDPAPASASPDK